MKGAISLAQAEQRWLQPPDDSGPEPILAVYQDKLDNWHDGETGDFISVATAQDLGGSRMAAHLGHCECWDCQSERVAEENHNDRKARDE